MAMNASIDDLKGSIIRSITIEYITRMATSFYKDKTMLEVWSLIQGLCCGLCGVRGLQENIACHEPKTSLSLDLADVEVVGVVEGLWRFWKVVDDWRAIEGWNLWQVHEGGSWY